MSGRLFCLFNRHKPAGRRAAWDGACYVGRCGHCNAPIFRVRRGRWKRNRPDIRLADRI